MTTLTHTRESVIDIEHVVDFVATLPDNPIREQLAQDFRDAETDLAAVRARAVAIGERLRDLTVEYLGATGKTRDALLTERTSLAAEAELLPTECGLLARRYAEALSLWAQPVYAAAVAAHNMAVDELQPDATRHAQMVVQLNRFSSEDGPERNVAIQADRVALLKSMKPVIARRERARLCTTGIEGILKRDFGDDSRHGRADAAGIQRWIEGVTRSVTT